MQSRLTFEVCKIALCPSAQQTLSGCVVVRGVEMKGLS